MGGQAYPWVLVLKNHLLHRNLSYRFTSVLRPIGRLYRLFLLTIFTINFLILGGQLIWQEKKKEKR